MASAPRSSTTPRTACTICCQQSLTMVGSCGGWASGSGTWEEPGRLIWGSAMGLKQRPQDSLQVVLFQPFEQERWRGRELGVAIFARLARVCHGTEGDVRAIGVNLPPQRTQRVTEEKRGTGQPLRLGDSQALGHLVVEETLAGAVGLDPFAVDDELGDGTLAGALHDFVDGAGSGLDVDGFVGDVVFVEKALGFTAVGARGGGIDGEIHEILQSYRDRRKKGSPQGLKPRFKGNLYRSAGSAAPPKSLTARLKAVPFPLILYTRSSWEWVRSLTTLPVLSVDVGSKSRNQHSSSATGLCSTPRGTTTNSPSSIHS